MTEETENLVLQLLRRIRASQEHVEEEISNMKLRLSSLEQAVGQFGMAFAGIQASIGQFQISMGSFHRRPTGWKPITMVTPQTGKN